MIKQYSPYPFRMPADTREQIEEKANEAGRSLQQEMLRRIELTLKMETLLRSKVPSVDALYDFLFDTLAENRRLENTTATQSDTIVSLKQQLRLLTQSTRISEEQRFDTIRRGLNAIQDILDKTEKALPPVTDIPKDDHDLYNPNR